MPRLATHGILADLAALGGGSRNIARLQLAVEALRCAVELDEPVSLAHNEADDGLSCVSDLLVAISDVR